jgi:hypothetical protein
MAARKLEKSEWQRVLQNLSTMLGPKQAEIEVGGLHVGDQIEAEWLPLYGVVYDHKSDIVEIALEGIDHLIQKPREIWIDQDEGSLISLEIVDADGSRQIVRLRDPLALPAAK